MKPVFPYHLLLRHLRIERVRVDMRRNTSRVKSRVEIRNVDSVGQLLGGQLNQCQSRCVMPVREEELYQYPSQRFNETRQIQGSEVRQVRNLLNRLLIQDDSFGEQSSMHYPMHYQLNLSCSVFLQTLVLFKVLQEQTQGSSLVRDVRRLPVFDIMPLIRAVRIREFGGRRGETGD